MTLAASNVRVAVTGAVAIGGDDFTAPTDADTVLTGASDLGYISDDGITESRGLTTNTIKGWQNGDTVREVVTAGALTFKFVMIETKKETVETFYGSPVDDATGKVVIVPAKTGGRKPYVIDVVDGSDFIRTYVPQAEITDVGDLVYKSGDAIGYEVTITGYPDPSITDDDGDTGSAVKWYSSLVTAPAAPTVTAATPSAAAEGELVEIAGTGFTGATAVKFGDTSATDFTVVSDSIIVASVPAGDAGAANITVTNATGTSAVFDYTRGA